MYKPITTAVAVLALAGAGAAFAHPPANGGEHATSKAAWQAKHAERMQTHLAKLKDWLKITSAQEPAWNGFAQAMQNMHPTMKSRMKPEAANLTGAEIFEAMATRAEQRAQKAQALAEAADNLYGRLSSEQKAAWNMAMGKMLGKKHHRWDKHGDKHHDADDSHAGMQGSVGGRG